MRSLIIYVLFGLTLFTSINSDPVRISCYTCHGELSDEACNQNEVICPPDKQACYTHVWAGKVSKMCMSRDTCEQLHEDSCSEDGDCSQCCTSDKCNRIALTEIEMNQGHMVPVPTMACTSQPCLNGGTCTDFCGCAVCDCLPGFAGDFCESTYELCWSNQCMNGGTEITICLCPDGTTGANCETKLCVPECQNGGSCVGIGQCLCPPEYTGDYCESVNPCYPDFCVHGMCFEGVCLCQPGYTGTFCNVTIDLCLSDPCMNGGTCIPTTGECACPPIYTGPQCETCLCENGGFCIGGLGCYCPPTFTGELCDNYIPPGVGYDCTPPESNPCTQTAIDLGYLYWAHTDCTKFVQCVPGPPIQCSVMDCAGGLYWDICEHVCNRLEDMNCPEAANRCEFDP